ncbi:MAG: phosphonate C-P lyase system protein PhnG [Hyphomicrobium aestuarii]|nr:phosphonate C-P lyase system protein PhnG [Hyphomicrobium aestuarii]
MRHDDRQRIMRLTALATPSEREAAIAAFDPDPDFVVLRAPETGLVMLQGRTGGDGAPFNAGEASVTRAVVQLATGETGYAYLLGRSSDEAIKSAIIDALGQRPDAVIQLERAFLTPVSQRLAEERARQQADTDATRVNFFTLERGESPS